MHIDVDVAAIKTQQPYRQIPAKRKLVKAAVDELLEKKAIRPSKAPIASPVVVIMQKRKAHFCLDLREVNSKTKADAFPLLRQDPIFIAVGGTRFLSTLDLNKGYWQFGVAPGSRKFTAFATEDGLWEFLVAPFGLRNPPAHFQRMISSILADYRWNFALCFLDDIIVFSKTFEDHLRNVNSVLKALSRFNLTVAESKYHSSIQASTFSAIASIASVCQRRKTKFGPSKNCLTLLLFERRKRSWELLITTEASSQNSHGSQLLSMTE